MFIGQLAPFQISDSKVSTTAELRRKAWGQSEWKTALGSTGTGAGLGNERPLQNRAGVCSVSLHGLQLGCFSGGIVSCAPGELYLLLCQPCLWEMLKKQIAR